MYLILYVNIKYTIKFKKSDKQILAAKTLFQNFIP